MAIHTVFAATVPELLLTAQQVCDCCPPPPPPPPSECCCITPPYGTPEAPTQPRSVTITLHDIEQWSSRECVLETLCVGVHGPSCGDGEGTISRTWTITIPLTWMPSDEPCGFWVGSGRLTFLPLYIHNNSWIDWIDYVVGVSDKCAVGEDYPGGSLPIGTGIAWSDALAYQVGCDDANDPGGPIDHPFIVGPVHLDPGVIGGQPWPFGNAYSITVNRTSCA